MAAGQPDLLAAPPVLHTARLRLAAPRPEFAEGFAEGVTASMPTLGFVRWSLSPRDLAWAQRFIADDMHSRAAGQDLTYHLFEAAGGRWAGRIDVHSIDFDAARGEIGYVVDARHAGRGLMREAVLAVIDLCFALGFERIEAMSDARNLRALHFAEAVGLQREGLLRHHERDVQGAWCDMVLYAMLRADRAPPAG